jgi:hypothetical protein
MLHFAQRLNWTALTDMAVGWTPCQFDRQFHGLEIDFA